MPQELTENEIVYLKSQGINPEDIASVDRGQSAMEEPQSEDMGIVRAATAPILAHAGGLTGGGLAALGTMAALTALTGGSAAPVTIPTMLGIIGAGTIAGAGGGYLGQTGQEALLGKEKQAALEAEAQKAYTQRPVVSNVAELATGAMIGGGKPSLKNLQYAFGRNLPEELSAEGQQAVRRAAIGNVLTGNAIGAGAQTGLVAAEQLYNTGTIDPMALAKQAALGAGTGAIFTNPNWLGKTINPRWQSVEEHVKALKESADTEMFDDQTDRHDDILADTATAPARILDRRTAELQQLAQQGQATDAQVNELNRIKRAINNANVLLNPKALPDSVMLKDFKKMIPKVSDSMDNTAKAEAIAEAARLNAMTNEQKRQHMYEQSLKNIDTETAGAVKQYMNTSDEYVDFWKQQKRLQDQDFLNSEKVRVAHLEAHEQNMKQLEKQREEAYAAAREEEAARIKEQMDEAQRQRNLALAEEARRAAEIERNQQLPPASPERVAKTNLTPDAILRNAIARQPNLPEPTMPTGERTIAPRAYGIDEPTRELAEPLEQSGVADTIEALSMQGKTVTQISRSLRITPEEVNAVRDNRGIPPRENSVEFNRWVEARNAEEGGTQFAPKKEKENAISTPTMGQQQLHPADQEHIVSNNATVGSLLKRMALRGDTTAGVHAAMLLNKAGAEALNVRIKYIPEHDRAWYRPASDDISIGNNDLNHDAVIHEVVHALTFKKIPRDLILTGLTGEAYKKRLDAYLTNPRVDTRVKELLKCYLEAAKKLKIENELFGKDGKANTQIDGELTGPIYLPDSVKDIWDIDNMTRYAMKNLSEFIAQIHSSPEFMHALESFESGRSGNLFQRILNAIKKLIGVDVDNTLFDRTFKATLKFNERNRVNPEPIPEFYTPEPNERGAKPGNIADFALIPAVVLRKLGFNENAKVEPEQLSARLKNLLGENSSTWEYLNQFGLKEFLAEPRSVNELKEWGNRIANEAIQVHAYGMDRKVSKETQAFDKMNHEWYDELPEDVAHTISGALVEAFDGTNLSTNDGYRIMRERAIKNYIETGPPQPAEVSRKEFSAMFDKYVDLYFKKQNQPPSSEPEAPSSYQFVSPFQTNEPMPKWTTSKSGRNVQRVDVVVPHKDKYDNGEPMLKTALWRPNENHEAFPNTLGWAMVQYKTGPNGEKIAFIGEVQSDWAQARRNEDREYPAITDAAKLPEGWKLEARKNIKKLGAEYAGYVLWKGEKPMASGRTAEETLHEYNNWLKDKDAGKTNYGAVANHPLLNHYNRLVMKAAIAKARKEGATHIVVSDAETAMMSEGHDAHVPDGRYSFDTEQEAKDYIAKREKQMPLAYSKITEQPANAYDKTRWDVVLKEKPRQEPGMRFNYDNALPKIAEELTGNKGQKISLGEHKNAYDGYVKTPLTPEGSQPRNNLIFKNPDGTFKTDASGIMFEIKPTQKYPYSLTGKDKDIAQYAPRRDVLSRIVDPITSSAIDKVRDISPDGEIVAKGFTRTLNTAKELQGKFWTTVEEAGKGLNDEQLKRLDAALSSENRDKRSHITMLRSADERAAYRAIRKTLSDIQDHRLAINEPVMRNGVPTKPITDKWYYPTTEEIKMGDIIRQNTDAPMIAKFKQDFQDNYLKHLPATTPAGLDKAWADFVDAHQGSAKSQSLPTQAHFNAMRQQAGIPLPDSLRRMNPMENMANYIRRASMDMAHYENIEDKPDVAARLGYNEDAWGNKINRTGINNIHGNDSVKSVLDEIRGEVTPYSQRAQRASEGLASSIILGPLTEIHKMAAAPFQASVFAANPVEFAKAMFHGATNIGRSYFHAKENGLVVENPQQVKRFFDSNVSVAEKINLVAKGIRGIYTLNGLTEKLQVGLAQGTSEYLVQRKIDAANNGDKIAINTMKQLDPDWTAGKTYAPEQERQLASRMAGFLTGTRDARTMPTWMLHDNEVSSFFKLMSWNVSQTNSFMKNAWAPAMQGNIAPLIMTTFGATLGGFIIKELRERASGKESPIPSLADIAASSKGIEGNIPAVAYNWMSAAGYGGLGGLISLAAKYPFDIAYRNLPQGAIFPLDEVTTQYTRTAMNVADALAHDPTANVLQIASRAMSDMIVHNSQLGRVAMNQLINAGVVNENMDKSMPKFARRELEQYAFEKKQSDAMGQLKRFKQVEGVPVNPSTDVQSNPYLNLEQKRFKQTQDVGEAASIMPDIIRKYIQEYSNNPDVLLSKIEGLKANPYDVFPSLESSPLVFSKYLRFLQREHGQQAASKMLMDYMTRNTINQIKSSIVPL